MDDEVAVLFSGGIDSSTCLYMANSKYEDVTPVFVKPYGQDFIYSFFPSQSARIICFSLELPLEVRCDVPDRVANSDSAFVKNRNLNLITKATTISNNVIIGVNYSDENYPDASVEAIECFEKAVNYGIKDEVSIKMPVQGMSKSSQMSYLESQDTNYLMSVITKGQSCDNLFWDDYEFSYTKFGFGCWDCEGCRNRVDSIKRFLQTSDITEEDLNG